MDIIRAFFPKKSGHFFNFQKRAGGVSPLPLNCEPVSLKWTKKVGFICFSESPLKMIENDRKFYFILKTIQRRTSRFETTFGM